MTSVYLLLQPSREQAGKDILFRSLKDPCLVLREIANLNFFFPPPTIACPSRTPNCLKFRGQVKSFEVKLNYFELLHDLAEPKTDKTFLKNFFYYFPCLPTSSGSSLVCYSDLATAEIPNLEEFQLCRSAQG